MQRFMGGLLGAVLLALQLGTPSVALAQLAPAPAVDRCGKIARRVARFAAQTQRWSVALPTVQPVGRLANGVLFRATANPACCDLTAACGVSSEVADTLIGTVGERLFALTQDPPDWRRVPARPWRAAKWSAFLAAAHAGPRTAQEALTLAWLVLASVRPGLGRLDDEAALATLVAAPPMQEFSGVLAAMQQAGLAPLRSTATPRAAGYDVTLWASHYAPNKAWLREIGAGLSSDEEFVRVRARIESTAAVTIDPPEPLRELLAAARSPQSPIPSLSAPTQQKNKSQSDGLYRRSDKKQN